MDDLNLTSSETLRYLGLTILLPLMKGCLKCQTKGAVVTFVSTPASPSSHAEGWQNTFTVSMVIRVHYGYFTRWYCSQLFIEQPLRLYCTCFWTTSKQIGVLISGVVFYVAGTMHSVLIKGCVLISGVALYTSLCS